MSGTWYPSLQQQLHAERVSRDALSLDDDWEWESIVHERAADGDVEALAFLREHLTPIDYDELGWAD